MPERTKTIVPVVGPGGAAGFAVVVDHGRKLEVEFFNVCGCCVPWKCGDVTFPGGGAEMMFETCEEGET